MFTILLHSDPILKENVFQRFLKIIMLNFGESPGERISQDLNIVYPALSEAFRVNGNISEL